MLAKNNYCQTGMTLLGLLIVLSIITLLTSVGITSYKPFIQKSQILDVARALEESLRLAKQWSLVTNQKYYLDINSDTTIRCWGVSPDSSCSCADISGCSVNTYSINPDYAQMNISSNRTKLLFSPLFGNTNGATYKLTNQNYAIHIVVSTIGRIRICMAKGESVLYASC